MPGYIKTVIGLRSKASSLISTLIFILIISILLSAILWLAYFQRQQASDLHIQQQLDHHLEEAISVTLADEAYYINNADSISLFNEENDSVYINRREWGLFSLINITARYEHFYKVQSFLAGARLPAYMNHCIYLADHKRALFVVGKTSLNGDICIPALGIRNSFIGSRGYELSTLYTGKKSLSDESLPPPDTIILHSIRELISMSESLQISTTFKFANKDTISSFQLATDSVFSTDTIEMKELDWRGNIMIVSSKAIVVDSTCKLKDLILVAPYIYIKDGFHGSFQAFARDSIIIGNNCSLRYPSVLALVPSAVTTTPPKIRIGKSVSLQGILLAMGNNELLLPRVQINSDFFLHGVSYCNGYMSLTGKVYGSVVTDYFLYERPDFIYENYLLDLSVDRNKMSSHFVGSSIFGKSEKREIVQWLY